MRESKYLKEKTNRDNIEESTFTRDEQKPKKKISSLLRKSIRIRQKHVDLKMHRDGAWTCMDQP